MTIELVHQKEAEEIAEIHKKEISFGFLSTLKKSFLTKLYSAVIRSPYGFCLVAKEKEKVIGFVSGVTNIDRLYLYFLRRYFFHSTVVLLPQVFNFKNLRKILETLFYPIRKIGSFVKKGTKKEKLPKAELLSIAIDKNFQRQGLGGELIKGFISEMKKRKVKEFKVIVGENLMPAINFYEKHGFEFIKTIKIHSNQSSRVYIYQI